MRHCAELVDARVHAADVVDLVGRVLFRHDLPDRVAPPVGDVLAHARTDSGNHRDRVDEIGDPALRTDASTGIVVVVGRRDADVAH
jgi:hypothetical protein